MTPLRVGIVGCGRVTATLHLPALRGLAGFDVTAIADVDPSARAQVGDRFSIARRFSDAVELTRDPAVDVVAVCVPARFHADVAVAALEAGKHLFLEKPMALDLDACDRILGAAAKARTRSAVGFNLRAHGFVARAREVARRGELGDVRVLESRWTSAIRAERELPAWRDRRELGGGVLCEIAVHHFDLWRHLLGCDVEQVYAVAGPGGSVEESAVVTATMANGTTATGVFAERTHATNDFALHGTRGRLEASLYRYDGLRLRRIGEAPGSISARILGLGTALGEIPRALSTLRHGGDYLSSYRREWESFRSSILDGGPPLCTLEEGRAAVQVLLAALASASRGRPVRVSDAPRDIGGRCPG